MNCHRTSFHDRVGKSGNGELKLSQAVKRISPACGFCSSYCYLSLPILLISSWRGEIAAKFPVESAPIS
jgi:hypothetical protein